MTDIATHSPALRFDTVRGGNDIDTYRDADIVALSDSIAVRQIAGSIPADFDLDATIAKVTAVTDALLALEHAHVTDSASSRAVRSQYAETNESPSDLFDVCFFGEFHGTYMTVTVTVDPGNPIVQVHVLHTEQEVDGGSVDIADRSLRLALQKRLNKLAA
ncbi:hypothetical protein [Curtobacterium sp. MCSS17_016]|uniref:hypothetical protein n=1 Tax=Curtobacterium sp. MCSS17_016 TaxID=2175644 RepID=UPI000DAA98A6|nr:hypothetical protein [Curtobacterium sp. MCSS17_016]WIE81447.1 hypothetical protein DEJ19_019620 [Curtobacterium sp. MCSS17_016]